MTEATRRGFVGGAMVAAATVSAALAQEAGEQGRQEDAYVQGKAAASAVNADSEAFDVQYGDIKEKNIECIGAMGLTLRGIAQVPLSVPAASVPVALIMHGYHGPSRGDFYDNLAAAFVRCGIAVVRFDFGGHGTSDGEFADSTIDTEVEDLSCEVDYVKSLPWVGDVALVGHSQGAVISELYAGRNPEAVAALALIDGANIIGSNPDNNEPYDESNAKYKGKSEAYVKSTQGLDTYGEAAGFQGPVCVVHGLDDEIIAVDYSDRLRSVYSDIDYHVLAHAGHVPTGRFNDVAGIIGAFLERVLFA